MDLNIATFDEGTIESDVSDDAFMPDPVLEKYQTLAEHHHWTDELEAARKERQQFDERGNKTIARYANEMSDTGAPRFELNLFHQNVGIKLAALYAQTPVPDIKRRNDDADDDVARVAGMLLQRNISYELDECNFDAKIKQMLFDRLVPGLGVSWVRFEQEEGDADYEHTVDPMTGQPAVDEMGQPVAQEVPGSHIKSQYAETDYVSWKDFFWSPCVTWQDCRWVARKLPMNKDAVQARFGRSCPEEKLSAISFAAPRQSSDSSDTLKPKNLTESTIDVIEIWDKERKLVFWVTQACDIPLDVQQDANEFEGFFPTPLPPLGDFTTSNTIPLSDFRALQSQYRLLDTLYDRAVGYSNFMRLNFMYDAKHEGIKNLYKPGTDLTGIPIKDWAITRAEGGSMRESIEFTPIQEPVMVHNATQDAIDRTIALIYNLEGISDFQRGVQQPYVTGMAAQATAQAGAGRLQMAQKELAEYIQRVLRLKAHLICKFYEPKTFLARAGTISQFDQQFVEPALQLLRNEQLRNFRLNVSVESIQNPVWGQESQEADQILQSVAQFMAQMMPLAQQTPQTLPFLMELLKFRVSKLRGSKALEGIIDKAIEAQIQAAAQKQSTPPKPSPEEMRAQSEQQALQADMQKVQMQEQTKQLQIQVNAQLEAARLENERLNTQLKAAQLQHSIDHDERQQQLERAQAVHQQAVDMATLPTGL